VVTPQTYVTMPMGDLSEEKKEGGGGIIGTMLSPFSGMGDLTGGAGNAFKAAGHGMVSGTKMIGSGIAKGASALGQGVKDASGKIVDGSQAVGGKVASMGSDLMPGGGKSTPNRTALNDIYEGKAKEGMTDSTPASDKKQAVATAEKSNNRLAEAEIKVAGNKPKKGIFGLGGHKETAVDGEHQSAFYQVSQEHNGKALKTTDEKPAIAAAPPKAKSEKKHFGLPSIKAVKVPGIGIPGLKKKEAPATEQVSEPTGLTASKPAGDLDPAPSAVTPEQPVTAKTATLDPMAALGGEEKTETASVPASESAPAPAQTQNQAPAPAVAKAGMGSKMTRGFSKLNPFSHKKQTASNPGHQL
ncbi:MAG: hypothetical protein KC777_24380, partial [Cyanobacteria bacterium HKST-UBA02]|nr:hypothetical protein [Cyanobacteria bacterium HKST-UBA02]